MEWDEDEQFLAEWIFDESRSGSSEVTRKLDIDQSSKDEVTLTSPEVVRRVYDLGRAVADVFKEFSLHFWTSGGTTLGAVRHRGLIPWDDDLDVCVPESEEPLLVGDVAAALADRHSLVVCPANTFGYRAVVSKRCQNGQRGLPKNYREHIAKLTVPNNQYG